MKGVYDDEALLEARVGDALDRCARGNIAMIPYLSPRQRVQTERELNRLRESKRAWFYGGYAQAERVCLFLLPDYLVELSDGPICDRSADEMRSLIGEELDGAVTALRIKGSGYRTLSHRDYLGSILGLGLERDAIGDIAVQNDREAILFCTQKIADFLSVALTKVATDTVTCSPCVIGDDFTDGKQYAPIYDTVASARLDCVVAALTNQSREAAQRAVRGGLVEVNFEPIERTDLVLEAPAWISVRGFGRYRLRAFDGETKKGRLRMKADRLI